MPKLKKYDILSNFHTMCGNLRITTLFWRTLDPKMVAKKMMLPTTKRMTMMKTTPSTPSTMTNSSSNSLEKSGRVQEASQSLHEHPFSSPWKFVKNLNCLLFNLPITFVIYHSFVKALKCSIWGLHILQRKYQSFDKINNWKSI